MIHDIYGKAIVWSIKSVNKKKSTFDEIFSDPKYGTFTSFQVIKLLNIRQERLQEWLYKKFIKPEVPATGRGTKNYFSKKNLYEISLFNYLLGKGLSRKEASKILKTDIMDPITQYDKKIMKSLQKNISFKSISPMLIIYKSGKKYLSKVIFDNELNFRVEEDIVQKKIDEIQIINIDNLIKEVNNAVCSMS